MMSACALLLRSCRPFSKITRLNCLYLHYRNEVALKFNRYQFNCSLRSREISTPILKRSFSSHSKLPFEINTNVSKDVLLYSYNNPRFFRILNFFGISQFVFWMYLAHFSITTLKDPKPNMKSVSWWDKVNVGMNKYRNGVTILCSSLGCLILYATVIFTSHSVHSLILLKGGEKLLITTFLPFRRQRSLLIPLEHMTCTQSRNNVKVYLPIKVQGYWLHFLLDKQGTFTNTKLFDFTVGIKRTWKK